MTHSNDFVSVHALHRDIKAHSNIKIVIAWLKEIIHDKAKKSYSGTLEVYCLRHL